MISTTYNILHAIIRRIYLTLMFMIFTYNKFEICLLLPHCRLRLCGHILIGNKTTCIHNVYKLQMNEYDFCRLYVHGSADNI